VARPAAAREFRQLCRAKANHCKGMIGLLQKSDEVMKEGKKMESAGADLALIGTAQKVERYEMAGYITARNLGRLITSLTAATSTPIMAVTPTPANIPCLSANRLRGHETPASYR